MLGPRFNGEFPNRPVTSPIKGKTVKGITIVRTSIQSRRAEGTIKSQPSRSRPIFISGIDTMAMTTRPSFRRKPEPRDVNIFTTLSLKRRVSLDSGLRRNDKGERG